MTPKLPSAPAGGPPLKGLHLNWTAPFFTTRPADEVAAGYRLRDFELLTTILCARMWRALNGPIELHTDEVGAEYYGKNHLLDLYDRVETEALSGIQAQGGAAARYWAALPRLAVLPHLEVPFAFVDYDLVPLRTLRTRVETDFLFAHWERLDSTLYPPADQLPNPAGLDFTAWDWQLPAANMSVMLFRSAAHCRAVAEKGLAYVFAPHQAPPGMHPLALELFVSQRLVLFEASRLGLRYGPWLDYHHDPQEFRTDIWKKNPLFHHVWYLKDALLKDPMMREEFCLRYLSELLLRFPDELGRVSRIPDLAAHLRRLRQRTTAETSGRWIQGSLRELLSEI